MVQTFRRAVLICEIGLNVLITIAAMYSLWNGALDLMTISVDSSTVLRLSTSATIASCDHSDHPAEQTYIIHPDKQYLILWLADCAAHIFPELHAKPFRLKQVLLQRVRRSGASRMKRHLGAGIDLVDRPVVGSISIPGVTSAINEAIRQSWNLIGFVDDVQTLAAGKMPCDVAVQRPDAGIIELELDRRVSIGRDEHGIATHRVPGVDDTAVPCCTICESGTGLTCGDAARFRSWASANV